MKNVVIFGIFLCLVTFNLPKALFHCHEHQEVHTDDLSDFSFAVDEAHCFVCDVNLSNYVFSTLQSIQFDPKVLVHGKEQACFVEKLSHFNLQEFRGPPTIV